MTTKLPPTPENIKMYNERFGIQKNYLEYLELSKEDLSILNNDKIVKKQLTIPYFDPISTHIKHTKIEIVITACDHKDSLVPISDDGGDMGEASMEDTFFVCQKCGFEKLL